MHSQARPDIYKDVQHFYTLEQFAEDMANPEILFLAASVSGKMVGMCEIKYHTAGGGSITRKGREPMWRQFAWTKNIETGVSENCCL